MSRIIYPFDLYEKQKPRGMTVSANTVASLDFNDHPSWEVTLDADWTPASLKGEKGTCGIMIITCNTTNFAIDLTTAGGKTTSGNAGELSANSAAMGPTDILMVGVYFVAKDVPTITATEILTDVT